MIRAPFDRPDVLEKLRPAYLAARSLILPGAAEVNALPKARLRRFEVANRGRYDVAALRDRSLTAELHRFAEALTGARLVPFSLRLFRFRHRGYALYYDDALTRVNAGVELTLDLSRELAGPPAIYRSGPSRILEIPQFPGLVAVVERGPSTFRHDRYLPAEVGRAQVLRLRAAFTFAD